MGPDRSALLRPARWIVVALIAASCAGGEDAGDTAADVPETTAPAVPSPERVAVIVPAADDPIVDALEAAGVDVVAIVIDPAADGSCPSDPIQVPVGCDGGVVVDARAGTLVGVSVPESRVRDVLADLESDDRYDLMLAAVPGAELGATASITVIPPDIDPASRYLELVAGEVAGDDAAVYEVQNTASGPVRVATAVFGGPSTTGRTDDTADTADTGGVEQAADAAVVWAFETGFLGSNPGIHSRAAIFDDAAYFLGYDGVAYAVDLATGGERWRHEVAGEGPQPPSASYVAVVDGAVVFSYSPAATDHPSRRVLGLDVTDGALLWELPATRTDIFGGHPVVAGASVVLWLGDADGANLVALDPRSGAYVWRSPDYEGWGLGPPRVIDGLVFAGTVDGSLVGVDQSDGSERFRFDDPESALVGIGGIASRPAWRDGVLFFGADDGVFRAVDTSTGTLLWEFDTESADLPSSPLLIDDVVVFGAFDERLYGLDAATGELRWASRTGDTLSSALQLGPDVVIGAGNNVVGVDPATGTVRWKYSTDGWVTDSPVPFEDDVILQVPGQLVRLTPPR